MYHISLKNDKPDIGYMEAKVSQLMQRGIRLADCSKMLKYYTDLSNALKSDFINKYGVQNPNSPKQLVYYIQQLSDNVSIDSKNDIIDICYDDSTGKWTTKADAMDKLADLGYDFARDLLDYRKANKYAESIRGIVDAADSNNLIHSSISLGTTNRINYSKPGLLTIPKQLLWSIIAPFKQGNVLYSVDIKNQEPSILINMTGAEELKYALEAEEGVYEVIFRQCFQPVVTANILIDTLPENRRYTSAELRGIGTISPALYSSVRPMTSEVMYGSKRVMGIETICIGSEKGVHAELPDKVDIELEDGSIVAVDVEWGSDEKYYKKENDYSIKGTLKGLTVNIPKAERKEFKQSYLAFTYGASAFGIKNTCKIIDGEQVYRYLSNIKALKEYRSKIDKHIRQGNTSICTIFGTMLYPDNYNSDKQLKRKMLDHPIQGSAADILSLLIRHFYDYTEKNNLTDKMSLYYTRHDELIIEVDGEWLKEVGEEKVEAILRDMNEHQIDDWVPFKIEVVRTKAGELSAELDEEE